MANDSQGTLARDLMYELMGLIIELEVFADLVPDGELRESLHTLVAEFTNYSDAIAREVEFLEKIRGI